MSIYVYLVGGSHDCIKLSIDSPKPQLEMLKRLNPEIGRSTVANRPVLAIIERYTMFAEAPDGSLIYAIKEE